MSKLLAKRVSNFELFFDLAVVLAIGQLTSAFHVEHIGFSQFLSFFAACAIMLNIWNNEAFYYNKYGDSRTADIYTVIVLMLWLGNIALSFNFDVVYLAAHPTNVIVFNSMLILCYLTIALQYFLKGRKLGFSKDIKAHITQLIFYSLPLVPIATGLVPYSNWVVGLYLLPLLSPLFYRPFQLEWVEVNFPHALERNQLLTIVTFGESVIATIKTYPLTSHPLEGILFFFGMASMFVFYIVQTFTSINHHPDSPKNSLPLFYSHAVIITSLLAFTVGLEFLENPHHHQLGVYVFIASVITFFTGVLWTSVYNQEHYRLNLPIIVQYALILILGGAVLYLFKDNLVMMGVTFLSLSNIIQFLTMRYRRKRREQNNIPQPDPFQNFRDFS